MDYESGIGDLRSLDATFSSGLLSQILATLHDDAIIVDIDGKIVTATRPHLLSAKSGDTLNHLGEAFIQGLQAVLGNRRDSFDHIQGSDERAGWIRLRVLPLRRDQDGLIIGAIIAHHDLTEVMRAEKRVSDTVHYMATQVHDLRTELNAVIGFSEMMIRESWGPLGDEHYHAYARHIHLSGTHLLHHVNQLLDLSKIDAQRHDLQEDEVNLAELLHQCCLTIGEQAHRNGLAITLESDPATPIIRADPRLTRRVALNLLTNAIKFTPTGGRVAAVTGMDKEGRPYLAIRDNGIGIAAEHLDKVMEPFSQVDSPQARRHAGNGSGLGLPLSKRFMELHGGSLHLDSEPERGTTATAWFPPHRVIATSQPSS